MKTTYSRGKHLAEKKLNKKKVISFIFLSIVFTFFVINILKEDEHQNNVNNESVETYIEIQNISASTNEVDTAITEIIGMPDTIGDYNVVGQLVIEKIDVNKYILNKTNDDSLNLSVTKLYGPKVNSQGNFCIIGHNFEGLFIDLKDLNINDTFYIIDKENCEKVTYQIYDKYTVVPTDLDCLNQDTKDKREVTLITCNPRRVN